MTYLCCLIAIGLTAAGCKSPVAHNMPPAQQMLHPGPGVDGPGPGVMLTGGAAAPAGFGAGAIGGPGGGAACAGPGTTPTSQIAFVGPEGTSVTWDLGGAGLFDSEPLIFPGRQNFAQAAIYRLKLTNVPGRPGVELYPTLEVGPANPRTDAYLAHNAIPVQFTEEDIDQVLSGNFVTKVIYLPDPEFQELALAGVETLVSTRLDPGVDPVVEADRRGAIMAILRLGNKDLEVPGQAGVDGGYQVVPATYDGAPIGMPSAGPLGAPTAGFVPGAVPPGFVAGATAPQWGMPMSGTPIGLPGPPHIPLGGPAGLRKHKIVNHTHNHIPHPTRDFRLDVRQRPGFSYPKPVSRMHINETVKAPYPAFARPYSDHHHVVQDCPQP